MRQKSGGTRHEARGTIKMFFSCLMLHASCLLLLFFLSEPAYARDYEGFGPFPTRSQNPVYLQALSLTPTRAFVLPEGAFEFRLDSSYSNLFEQGENATAKLDLDMELWRLVPFFSYGINENMELDLEAPILHFNGGFLDSFIQKFHRFFGFPSGGRERVANDRFSYLLRVNGADLMNYSTVTMGLGDIALHFKHQLLGEERGTPAIMYFVDLKFPTGQSSRGVGSGTVDYGFGLAAEASWKRLHGYFNAGYYVSGGNEAISNYMYGEMLAYMLAGEITILPEWSMIVQLDGSTPLLNALPFDEWEGVPLDLVIGFRGEVPKLIGSHSFIWQVAFAEDVTSKGPSVDFTVFVSIGLRFDMFGRSRPAGEWMAEAD